jgi:phospholipase/carboxylesterase
MYDTLSMDGAEITPASGAAPKQLVLFLHGVGADGHDLIGLAEPFSEILPDAQFLSPNAPFHCDMAPMGRQWFSLQSRETAHMLTGISSAMPLLNDYIDAALTRFNLTIEQLIVIGFSQGTMMALHTLCQRSRPCAAIVGYSGGIIASGSFADSITAKPPVCLIHGEIDDVVSFAAMPDAEATLRRAGLSVEAHGLPGLGHAISPEGITLGKEFLARELFAAHAA